MRNGAQLITYVDRFGDGDLTTVADLLTGPLAGVFTGVHLLPFFTPFDGADAGFDPTDHRQVDPRLGTWEDVARLASTHDVTVDLIVNHISAQSAQFVDFAAHPDTSRYAGMFLQFDSVFPAGATADELMAIYRPRPGLPFTRMTMGDGASRLMWTTFTPNQIDLDVDHPEARAYLVGILDELEAANVTQVRLDAIGYAIKTAGTSSFMTPATEAFIADICGEIDARGMHALLEVHAHHGVQVDLAKKVDRVYDFALPPLVLHSLQTGTAAALRRWLDIAPRNAISVLDTHDGIGVIDAGVGTSGAPGLLSPEEIDRLVENIHDATDGISRRTTGATASNLDLYQVNTTFYSALGEEDHAYLLARLTQLLCPGVPQVYYAGLLAAPNDVDLFEQTGIGRDVNRPMFDREAINAALQRPVVRSLLRLIRWRTTHPAFSGEFTVSSSAEAELTVGWRSERGEVSADIDFGAQSFAVTSTVDGRTTLMLDWDEF